MVAPAEPTGAVLARLLLNPPPGLPHHLVAWGGLLRQDIAQAQRHTLRQLLRLAVGLAAAVVASTLAGVWLMLWWVAGRLPTSLLEWLLMAVVPALPLLLALWMFTSWRNGQREAVWSRHWAVWQQQAAADWALLRDSR